MSTDKEAATKICPFMTYCINPQGVMHDGDQALYEPAYCVGTACAAWIGGHALTLFYKNCARMNRS
jgi:hypothetical protein